MEVQESTNKYKELQRNIRKLKELHESIRDYKEVGIMNYMKVHIWNYKEVRGGICGNIYKKYKTYLEINTCRYI